MDDAVLSSAMWNPYLLKTLGFFVTPFTSRTTTDDQLLIVNICIILYMFLFPPLQVNKTSNRESFVLHLNLSSTMILAVLSGYYNCHCSTDELMGKVMYIFQVVNTYAYTLSHLVNDCDVYSVCSRGRRLQLCTLL